VGTTTVKMLGAISEKHSMVQEGFADKIFNRNIILVTPFIVALFIAAVSVFKCTSRPLAIHIGALCGLIVVWSYFYRQAKIHVALSPRRLPVLSESSSDTQDQLSHTILAGRRDATQHLQWRLVASLACTMRRMISAIVMLLARRAPWNHTG
jgi:hypothetical protein